LAKKLKVPDISPDPQDISQPEIHWYVWRNVLQPLGCYYSFILGGFQSISGVFKKRYHLL